MIPEFDEDGALPAGLHRASGWPEVEEKLGFTERRRELLPGLLACLTALRDAGCTTAFLDGSFVTNKPNPGDFDVTYDPAGVDPNLLDPVFFMIRAPRTAQKAKYGGDILPNSIPGLTGSFVEFFQQTKDGGRKGIVLIDLRTLP